MGSPERHPSRRRTRCRADAVQPQRGLGVIADTILGPCGVGHGARPDPQGRPADGPWPRRLRQAGQQIRRPDHEAQPDTGQPPELAKAAQQRGIVGQIARQRQIRPRIGKAFVHDQMPDPPGQRPQRRRAPLAPVGVVGVDQHRQIHPRHLLWLGDLPHLPPRRRKAGSVFVVAARQHRRQTAINLAAIIPPRARPPDAGQQPGQYLDRGRGPRHRQHLRRVRPEPGRSHSDQRRAVGLGRQGVPRDVGHGWHRPGPPVDAGGQVDPVRSPPSRDRHVDIAAVIALHLVCHAPLPCLRHMIW